jgi:hypothetical protein
VYAEDTLLEGEEEKEGSIMIDGTLHSFIVTSLGRYKSPHSNKYIDIPMIVIAGEHHLIYFLVMLAFSGLSERPVRDGEILTVDHIQGRGIPYPHQPSNLRWASRAEQVANRAFLGESLED